MNPSAAVSQVQLLGGDGTPNHCGYCDTNGSISYGMWAHHLTNADYQALIDRGWRRSGKYLYKPDMKVTCCPAYTIRLPCEKFAISKSQKKSRRKVERYLEGTLSQKEMMEVDDDEGGAPKKPAAAPAAATSSSSSTSSPASTSSTTASASTSAAKPAEASPASTSSEASAPKPAEATASTSKDSGSKSLFSKLKGKKGKEAKDTKATSQEAKPAAPAATANEPVVTFEHAVPGGKTLTITTQRSFFSKESYEVFKKYQKVIHDDDSTEGGYQRFLVDSPLIYEKPTESNPLGYGSFHQHYRIDGRLIAVGVIDILPLCVSSVYLYYDPEFSFLSLGVYSALSEINLVNKLRSTAPKLQYYYLGYYIHSCPKMRYKAQYRPSDLLDPVSYTWVPLQECLQLLEKAKYTRFEKDANGEPKPEGPAPAVDLSNIQVGIQGQVLPLRMLNIPKLKPVMEEYARRVGPELAGRMIAGL